MSSIAPPASSTAALRFSQTWRVCASMSPMPAMVPSARREVMPEMKTILPAATLMPCEKWPLGWRSFLETICCLLTGRYSLRLLRRFAQRARVEGVVEFGALPLRPEHPLLGAEFARGADRIAARAHRPHAVEAHVDDRQARDRALEQNLLRGRHHGEPA